MPRIESYSDMEMSWSSKLIIKVLGKRLYNVLLETLTGNSFIFWIVLVLFVLFNLFLCTVQVYFIRKLVKKTRKIENDEVSCSCADECETTMCCGEDKNTE